MRLPHAVTSRGPGGSLDRVADARVCAATNDLPAKLSARELEVLRLVARGSSNEQIARLLYRSVSTVATHLRNIFTKIAVKNRTEAAAFAYRNRLLDD